MNEFLQIGWASASITPDRPCYVYGQIYYRISSYVHDPITATVIAITNGEEQAIFLSADMVSINDVIREKVKNALNGFDGIDTSKITFSATHTHNSTYSTGIQRDEIITYGGENIFPDMDKPGNILDGTEALIYVSEIFTQLIKDAWSSRKPGGVSFASDYAAIGFNRRPQFDLGNGVLNSKMYGDCSRPDFTRFEGTVDHGIDMLYTWDTDRSLTGVLVDVPCPSQVFELHSFISADYWGYARSAIRKRLGGIFILSICGAAGDQNPLDLVRISKDNTKELEAWNAQAGEVFRNLDMAEECEAIAKRIAEPVCRGIKKAMKNIETRPVFKHTVKQITLPIRKVTETDYKEAEVRVKKILSEFSSENRMTGKDLVRVFEPLGIVSRYILQQKGEDHTIQCNIIRLGNAAFCTNPFELFVEYGLRIRARGKARQVFSMQLTNGESGYLPTEAALAGGSYSSKPASTLIGPDSGKIFTETLINEINLLWE